MNKEVYQSNSSNALPVVAGLLAAAGIAVATALLLRNRKNLIDPPLPRLMERCRAAAEQLDHRIERFAS